MKLTSRLAVALLAALLARSARAASDTCIACHGKLTPGIVSDWQISAHARHDVACETCHGEHHQTADDASKAILPTPETCAPCHAERVAQFKRGKHARAWAAVRAIPNFHHGREARPGDPSGCASCHRIGLKTPEETAALRKAGATHGMASCDACHTRHLFSRAEAREPEACRTCHGAGEHLQWDAWTRSKHGIRYELQAEKIIPAQAGGPYCQLCHMPGGEHAVRTPWGSLGLRLPLPEDRAWADDRAALFRALGVLDGKGGPGPRYAAVEEAGIAHLDRISYQNERLRLTKVCWDCHGAPFVREQLDGRDGLLRGEAENTQADECDARHDPPRAIDGNGEAQSLAPAARGQDGRVDADDLAQCVDQRSARVAGVDGCVGLDEVGVRRDAVPTLALRQLGSLKSRDDPARDRLLQAERAPYGHHELPHLEVLRAADLHRGIRTAVDLEDGEVGRRIDADHLCDLVLDAHGHEHAIGALDDVVVGEDVTVGLDDHA